MDAAALLSYCQRVYGTAAAHPWQKYPQYAVLRHQSGKWYAGIFSLPRQTLGLPGDGEIDVLNVKCPPELVGSLRLTPGFLPAYHMNKEHWITILLDGSVDRETICRLLDQSYELTA